MMLLSGCSSLPNSGPDDARIDKEAAVKVTTKEQKVGIDYALVDLSGTTLPFFEENTRTSLKESFGAGRGGAPDIPLGYGDVVQVAIFEAQSGGLFIPSDAGSRPGNYISLPNQTIDRNGTISVPYAGRVQAAGRLKEQVEAEIENRLANRAIEPQVVITLITGRSSQVAVLGDVKEPAKIELTAAGERVLDAISQAGGLSGPGLETTITLQRRGKTATVGYYSLLDNPRENIYLAPGDTVFADRKRRTYTVFGAATEAGRFDFADTDINLNEAIAKAGGLRDDRADPAQVLVYRMMPRETVRRMGVNVSAFRSDTVPVVIRTNMRDPSGMFAARNFAVRDKDVIYISNSNSVELLKFLNIANSITSTAAGTTSDAVSTRDAVRKITP